MPVFARTFFTDGAKGVLTAVAETHRTCPAAATPAITTPVTPLMPTTPTEMLPTPFLPKPLGGVVLEIMRKLTDMLEHRIGLSEKRWLLHCVVHCLGEWLGHKLAQHVLN